MSNSCSVEQCGTLSKCDGCPSNKKSAPPHANAKAPEAQPIKKVFAVMSGKGGVGKSSVTALLASAVRHAGYSVGVMDADITGPSMPHAFGIHEGIMSDGEKMLPAKTQTGIELVSINLMLEDENAPVIWRGPILGGVVQQFWNDVRWGELDVLFIDMPPGTGDVPLTVFQSLPIDGVIVVTTPQDLVGMIVTKAVKMASMMDIPVLGIVENMAYALCPDCGKKLEIFGSPKGESLSAELGLPLLATLPIDPETARLTDAGRIESADVKALDGAVKAIAEKL